MTLLSRRRFFQLGALGGVAISARSYAEKIEPEWLDVSIVQLQLHAVRQREAVRILHLSDLHVPPGISTDFFSEAFRRGLALNPDFAVITGDFITRPIGFGENLLPLLQQLPKEIRTFACLGNHDGGLEGGFYRTEIMLGLIESAGIECLHNRSVRLQVRERTLQLIGLGDLWSGEFFPTEAFAGLSSPETHNRIVLVHNPDAKDQLIRFPWDLALCGHTHGGQIGIPVLREMVVPVIDRRFIAGLYSWERRQLYISRGLGSLHGMRFLCRPQITLLEVY